MNLNSYLKQEIINTLVIPLQKSIVLIIDIFNSIIYIEI